MADQADTLAERLQAIVEEGRDLARLHREACKRAAGCLPKIGLLLDAEDDLFDALTRLRTLSPLLVVDGAVGVGKSSLINSLVARGFDGDAEGPQNDSNDLPARRPPFLLPMECSGEKTNRPLIVRNPPQGSARRFLVGRPTLKAGSRAESLVHEMSETEWLGAFNQSVNRSDATTSGLVDRVAAASEDSVVSTASLEASHSQEKDWEHDHTLPLILEEPVAAIAWGNDLWLAEVDMQSAECETKWIQDCPDIVCVIPASDTEEMVDMIHQDRVKQHLEAGRNVFVVISRCDVAAHPASMIHEIFQQRFSDSDVAHEDGVLASVCAVSLRDRDVLARSAAYALPVSEESESSDRESTWDVALNSCHDGLQSFFTLAAERRLSHAQKQLSQAREAFVDWCSKGAKVVVAASEGFRQDAENVRLARDLITRNIDAAYLSHVFASVLIGKFDKLCAEMDAMDAPDLQGQWGRHATRRVMEEHLKDKLERGLRVAMHEALEEVTAEMAKQEQPAFVEIQRVARRSAAGSSVPWDAEVKRLECDLRPDQLQHFALHFFGSVSVGVLSGLGAAALELLIGEIMLGPLGIVAGVATFVAIGVQTADWPSVRTDFVRNVRSKQLGLVEKARQQLDFPELCERRKRRVLEQMDIILQRLMREVSTLSEAASEFARCAWALQQKRQT